MSLDLCNFTLGRGLRSPPLFLSGRGAKCFDFRHLVVTLQRQTGNNTIIFSHKLQKMLDWLLRLKWGGMLVVLFVLVSPGGPLTAYTQEYQLKHYWLGVEDGLPDSNPLKVYEDKVGYIWVWSHTGLFRYDGTQFEPFLAGENLYPRAGKVFRLFNDGSGLVWIVYCRETIAGSRKYWSKAKIYVIDSYSGTSYSFEEYFGKRAHFSLSQIRGIMQSPDGSLWVGVDKQGLWQYTVDGRWVKRLSEKAVGKPISFAMPKGEGYWLLDYRLVAAVDKDGALRGEAVLPGKLLHGEKNAIAQKDSLMLNLYVKSKAYNGTYAFYKIIQTPAGPQCAPANYTPYQAKGKRWWINKEAIKVEDQTESTVAKLEYRSLVPSNSLETAYAHLSEQGRLWLCINGKILVLSLEPLWFMRADSNSIVSNTRGIIPIRDSLFWINSYAGGYLLAGNRARPVRGGNHLIGGLGGYRSLTGDIWTGVHAPNVIRVDWPTFEMQRYPLRNDAGNRNTESRTVMQGEDGTLWVGTGNGLARYEAKRDTFIYLKAPMLEEVEVNHIYEHQGRLWMATGQGLYWMDIATEQVGKIEGLPYSNLSHLYDTGEGFWLATHGGGVVFWDKAGQHFQQYTENDGLSNNIVHAVYGDQQGAFWLPTNHGLNRFDPQSGTFQVFDSKDGTIGNEFNMFSHSEASCGSFLFGGISGLTRVYPERFYQASASNSPFFLHSYQFLSPDGKAQDRFSGRGISQIKLPSANSGLQLRPLWLDYREKGHKNWRYRFLGEEAGWENTTESEITLWHLRPGQHTLLIQAQSVKGKLSQEMVKLNITVPKPYYLQWWFWVGLLLTFSLLVMLIVWWRTRLLQRDKTRLQMKVDERTLVLKQERQRVQEQKEQLEQLNATKDRLFSIIGHELRGPLGFFQHAGRNLAYLLRKQDFERAQVLGRALEQKSLMVNTTLDNLLKWSLSQNGRLPHYPERLLFGRLVTEEVEAFKLVAAQKEIKLRCQGLDNPCTIMADPNAVVIVLRNLLSNALKFTPRGGRVELELTKQGNKVTLAIKDNGRGMEEGQLQSLFKTPQQSHSGTAGERGVGIGLVLCKELLERNEGTIRVDSKPGEGSMFAISLAILDRQN